MWQQIRAIAWAQFRITRNHLPRVGAGAVAGWFFSSLWYGMYAGIAGMLVVVLPQVPRPQLAHWVPLGLLGVFAFWQLVPMFTLATGWSLQLNKLRIYPVRDSALFGIEVLLRFTSAPEMLLVLLGAMVGLLRHPDIPKPAPLLLLLFVPLNLLLQLGIRDAVLHAFSRNRFRELFTALIIAVGVIPNILFRTGAGAAMQPYFFALANTRAAPWSQMAALALFTSFWQPLAFLLGWIALAYAFARWMFRRGLVAEEGNSSAARPLAARTEPNLFFAWPGRVFKDPLAALLQKELQSLVRMPKFRVLFGMACLLGSVVFIPGSLHPRDNGARFMSDNLVAVVNVYGLLLLSDALLLNAFGLDRGAAEVYFVTPLPLQKVFAAKNLAAIVFVVLQTAVILCVALLARAPITLLGLVSGLLASGVVTVFLLSIGNLTSVTMPRPIDPTQTFKKQAGAKMQVWFLGSSVALLLLVGFAFLARFAFQSEWIFLGVLLFEFLVGLLVYRFSLESAVARAVRERESIVAALSRSASPVSLG